MQAGDTFSLTKTDKYATLNGEAMLIEQTFTVDFKEKGVVHEVRYYR
jgi:hypothetical protein